MIGVDLIMAFMPFGVSTDAKLTAWSL